ncbi:MAG: LuxR C-terminal-related transcriptional regulator [Proteobacteria bacterium]|nr:LuxR C-terminal-related transcriptional regulator [Pseudomonadota bacterium]
MDRSERLLELVGLVYDSATDPTRWPRFLEALAGAAGGGMTCLTLEHPGASDQPVVLAHGIDPAGLSSYAEHFFAIDPLQPFVQSQPEGEISFGRRFITDSDLRKTEIFNDWYRPHGLGSDSLGGTVLRRGQVPTVLGLYQDRRAPSYDEEQLDLLQHLLPHVRQAVRIHYRLGRLARTTEHLVAALDTLAFGVVLVDARGEVFEANRAAREIAAQRDGLWLRDRELRAGRPEDTKALRACVAEVLNYAAGEGLGSGGTVLLARRSPKRPLEALVCPLPVMEPQSSLVAVIVTDPDAIPPVGADRLRSLYGLTTRESEVAEAFSRGETLAQIAERLEISINTVKARLQEIYVKTGTHRQADLMRLLLHHALRGRPEVE